MAPAMLQVIQLTPPGRGAVATLRIEGPGAVEAIQTHFRARGGRPLAAYPVDRLVVGHFGPERGEEVVVRCCADDAVELHCHGGLAAVAAIEESLMTAGCRQLAWPDWAADRETDPVAAAALVALADARTERTAAILLDQYHGALSRALGDIRQAVARGDHDAAQQQIDTLLNRAPLGRHLVQPWRVVLAGRVNVGKSSLINALAGYGRSIVHPTPGTTRDAVTLTTAIDGWPVELCDTAGLRVGRDAVELAGIERARERLGQADLAILVFDRSATWSAEDQMLVNQWSDALLVHNKCDLPSASDDRPSGLMTTALEDRGMAELLDAIGHRLVPDPPPPGAAIPITVEQVDAVKHLSTW
jgi:tRNA modification GTPase